MTDRTVAEIDQAIDAVYDELLRVAPDLDVESALSWHMAWTEHPELRRQTSALLCERYDAMDAEWRR